MTFERLFFINFSQIRSLAQNSRHLLFVFDSIIAGNSPVEVWVDNTADPNSVYIWDGSNCHYVAGRANNEEFNEKLAEHLLNTVFPRALKIGSPYYKIEYSDAIWEVTLEKILAEKQITKLERKFYELEKIILLGTEVSLPNQFSIHLIDKSLLDSNIENISDVKLEIDKMWGMSELFLEKGFGVCAFHDPGDGSRSIQGWCTAEYMSKGKCGIGIETFKPYQKLGIATHMTAKFVEYSVKHKIRPYWDTSADNPISMKVAEKSGFVEIQDYYTYTGLLKF